jgi:hypothetical protein
MTAVQESPARPPAPTEELTTTEPARLPRRAYCRSRPAR